jgi:hypothetical protein
VVRAAAGTNADLSALSVNQGTLTPEFNAATTDYTVNVGNGVADITVSATTDDPNATVTGTGVHSLNVGSNAIQLVVTAEDEITQKTYVITVRRDEGNNDNLKSLTVDMGTLVPEFNPNITNYSVTVENDVTNITILGETADSEASISGIGNHFLKTGENIFNIDVTASNGISVKRYAIVVVRKEKPTGVDDQLENPLTAYPNPASKQITIGGLEGSGILTIFDVSGRQWIQRIITSSQETISVSDLPHGGYLVQIVVEKKVRTIKIIVE